MVVVHRHALTEDQTFRAAPETGGFGTIVVSVEVADYTIRHTGRRGAVRIWPGSSTGPATKRTLSGSRRVEQNDFVAQELSLAGRAS